MTLGDIAFLALVLGAFAVFGVVLGGVTWWSERPRS